MNTILFSENKISVILKYKIKLARHCISNTEIRSALNKVKWWNVKNYHLKEIPKKIKL